MPYNENETTPQQMANEAPAPQPTRPYDSATLDNQHAGTTGKIKPFDEQTRAQLEAIISSKIEAAFSKLTALQASRDNQTNRIHS